ncbi:HAD superfamily hydrolase (TIGR01509 family) [Lachnospiraceae bacterium PF1-22]|uniref:HAD family hydrolase n=1 Tax=Ohessyouella blattaphilus TaxID=2949333 RepID=UPI00256439E0|nr:HAD family phosphatase [Lachnospiraceae bacterium OttesenSCG-928-J05]
MLTDKNAVIFDLDGTLVDSMWVWRAVDDEFLARYNQVKPEDLESRMEGMSYREVAQLFLDSFPELPHDLTMIMDEWQEMTYTKYCEEVPLKPGVPEFLEEMKRSGKKMGIATSNSEELARAVLEARGIASYFDAVCTADEARKGKPAPDVYLLAAKKLAVLPERCLVFEDVPMGILAGKNAGMQVCTVADDFSKEQIQRKRELADYYITDYFDVMEGTFEII